MGMFRIERSRLLVRYNSDKGKNILTDKFPKVSFRRKCYFSRQHTVKTTHNKL